MSRKSISHFWKLILSSVFLFAVTVPCAGKVNTSIKNISSKGLTFEYLPELSSGVEISNQILKLTIEGSDIFKSPGQPEVPVVYFTVAVPENSNPEVRIISADSGLSWNGRLPIFNIDDSSLDFTPVSTLSRPDEILGKPELRNLAGNKVLRIPVFPVKYRIGSNRVDLLKKIIIKIDFNENTTDLEKKGKYVSKIPRNQISRLSELILLNPDQARIFNVPEIGNFITPVWPNGLLYQFEIATEGIFSLKFEDIISRGVDLPVNGLNSSRLRLFSNGGGMLDENPELLTPVGLLECAIYMDDGGDNRFETGDRIIFYGRGAGGWFRDSDNVWKFQTNSYANRNIYWLNIDPSGGGRRMERISSSQSPDYTITSAPVKLHLETDQFIYYRSNFTGAGRSWYSFLFDGVSQLPLNFDLDSPDPSQDALLKAKVFASSSSSNPRILLHFNNIEIKNFQPSTNHISSESYETVNLDADLIRQNLNSLTMQQTTEGSKALFDWLEIEYYSELDGTKIFESAPLTGKVKYQFQNLANILVFDITDHNSVELYDGQNFINYQDENDSRRFIVIDSNKIKQVNATFEEYFPEDSDISDLWAQSNRADVILITPDGFWEQLNPLVDYYNRKQPPLIAKRVRLSEIYNKFSGGLQDPAAIRNFLMFTLSDRWRKSPDYVVFCGDGDYNYRNINREETGFYLPPFEGLKFGRCQDDWFVDFNFETVSGYLPEMIHGRLTVGNSFEMESIVEKIIAYAEEPEYGPWRNTITLVADDEVGDRTTREREHIMVQEELDNYYLPPSLNREKIYLTEYANELGREKPKSGDDLIKVINEGTVLINYMGHGNPTLWAHEHVFVLSRDLPRIEPSNRLPLYVAFTCDWAYWDNPSSQSFPEQLLALPQGGAIAAIASTRLTYAFSNSNLARNFYRNIFSDDYFTIGEALIAAKHQARIDLGPTYHLLGDPTLHLANPILKGKFNNPEPYPLQPLALSNISGEVFDQNLNPNASFSGEMELKILDTDILKTYMIRWTDSGGNEHEDPLYYKLPGSGVYRGQFSIENGEFSGNFIVPVDVSLGSSMGKISGYFTNYEIDGVIALDSIKFADHAADAVDSLPPEISVYFNHKGYQAGDKVGPNPLLIIDLSDSSGLNLTGKMGHGISVSIDNGLPIELTSSFSYYMDSYTSGDLQQHIGPLSKGKHSLEIVAWDSFNNFSVKEIEVDIIDGDNGLVLDKIYNWPNPFSKETYLTFFINKPVDYTIKIFTTNGKNIRTYTGSTRGELVSDILWDGRDNFGRTIGNGVYLYKVFVTDSQGNKTEGLGRIAYVR